MIIRTLKRVLIGLCFALPFGLATSAAVQASPALQEADLEDCTGCHNIIRNHWSDSAHGLATDDPVFMEAWTEKGEPEECLNCHATGYDPETGEWDTTGVACTVCHGPAPSGHPDEVMPTDVSARGCGECHVDTFAEWQTSVHGRDGLTCVRCHNAHTTDLRESGIQELCQACHNTEVHFYEYTAHAEQGLLCTDCHLRVSDAKLSGEMGDGHGSRVHTFKVDLETCNQCHSQTMHYPTAEGAMDPNRPVAASLMGAPGDAMAAEPEPANPLGFAVVASLVGMAFGMLLAPWLERWFKGLNRD